MAGLTAGSRFFSSFNKIFFQRTLDLSLVIRPTDPGSVDARMALLPPNPTGGVGSGLGCGFLLLWASSDPQL